MRNSKRTESEVIAGSAGGDAARFTIGRTVHVGLAVSALIAMALLFGGGCTSTGTGASGGCPQGFAECGALCCAPGTSCSAGACVYPYSTADLYIYMCPSTASCTLPNYFSLDSTCAPANSPAPGTCVNTGLQVGASQSYGFSNCEACGSNCSNPVSFDTPAGFASPRFASGITLSCQGATCVAPPDCGGPATGGAVSGSADSGGSSSGTSGAAGSSSGTSGAGGGGTTTGVTTCGNCPGQLECSTIVGNCVVQSCACDYVIDGSDGDSSWYLANGQCFMCAQNGLTTGDCSAAATAAAQAIVNCQ
jgi:hypothetical protein